MNINYIHLSIFKIPWRQMSSRLKTNVFTFEDNALTVEEKCPHVWRQLSSNKFCAKGVWDSKNFKFFFDNVPVSWGLIFIANCIKKQKHKPWYLQNVLGFAQNLSKKSSNKQINCPFLINFGPPRTECASCIVVQ